MRMGFIALLCAMSSATIAAPSNVFVANNGIQLINIPADQSVLQATIGSEFNTESISYKTYARKADDKYLMHCFTKKKKDSNNYFKMDDGTHHICLNETGKELPKGVGETQFSDFKVIKENINNKHIQAISVFLKGQNNVMSTLTDKSSIPNIAYTKQELEDKDYVYTYYSFDPSNGEILNGKIYEYYRE